MLPLELPTIQNWSCHNCGGCCKQHAIEITQEEFERIAKQGWRSEPGFEPGQPIFVWHAGPVWNRRYRLANREDGACVFLDDKGLCRIHSRFGEAAKPLACRVYPYALHPAGKTVAVSLRFSCPSVVTNRGRPLVDSKKDLRAIERLVVPDWADKTPPPLLTARETLDWNETLIFVDALDATFASSRGLFLHKLMWALFWVNLINQSKFDKIRGDRIAEYLDILINAAFDEIPYDLHTYPPPSSIGRMHFRLLAGQYARKDTSVEARAGWKGRVKLLRAAWKLFRGTGTVPQLQSRFQEVPFARLEEPFGELPNGADELLTRYFRVKIQGLHFFGPAYYDIPFAEGFQSLALIVPSILWIARWIAASAGRQKLALDDLQNAIAIADHHHGYSPLWGQYGFRSRVRTLAKLGDIERLIAWYSR
ncbi:MAG: Flagellin N-methylase [Planctomycetaceae bacterium]|nr:Flagellin N-methylase [Planctomycetaceae bacterium]